jgi:hypothetical protein
MPKGLEQMHSRVLIVVQRKSKPHTCTMGNDGNRETMQVACLCAPFWAGALGLLFVRMHSHGNYNFGKILF